MVGRVVRPDEIVRIVLFLAHGSAEYTFES